MRVLVCGGRAFEDRAAVALALKEFRPSNVVSDVSEHIIIHGGAAAGADKLAGDWCDVWGVRQRIFLANWTKYGTAAGPIRNQRMINEGWPDLVIAFPGGRGTADMMRRARAAGIEVREIAGGAHG